MRKKEKKLKISDINKYSQIERKNFIHKFIEHERIIMLLTTLIIILIICGLTYTCLFVVKNNNEVETYYDKDLKITYNIDNNGVNDAINLSQENIYNGNSGLIKEYTFKIKNNSNKKNKYLIYIEEDSNLIELDNCREKLVNLDALRFSIEDSSIIKLKKLSNDMYSIKKDYLDPYEVKTIKLKVWIDKNSMEDINKYHFHGKIIVTSL